jgi:hypothetical protein
LSGVVAKTGGGWGGRGRAGRGGWDGDNWLSVGSAGTGLIHVMFCEFLWAGAGLWYGRKVEGEGGFGGGRGMADLPCLVHDTEGAGAEEGMGAAQVDDGRRAGAPRSMVEGDAAWGGDVMHGFGRGGEEDGRGAECEERECDEVVDTGRGAAVLMGGWRAMRDGFCSSAVWWIWGGGEGRGAAGVGKSRDGFSSSVVWWNWRGGEGREAAGARERLRTSVGEGGWVDT